MIVLLTIDLGFGKNSKCGITYYNSMTSEFKCFAFKVKTKTVPTWRGGVDEVCEKIKEIHDEIGVDYILIEKNYGFFKKVCESLNMACGYIDCYCHHIIGINKARIVCWSPSDINKKLGMPIMKRDDRKARFRQIFIDSFGVQYKDYNQDMIDSYCLLLCLAKTFSINLEIKLD